MEENVNNENNGVDIPPEEEKLINIEAQIPVVQEEIKEEENNQVEKKIKEEIKIDLEPPKIGDEINKVENPCVYEEKMEGPEEKILEINNQEVVEKPKEDNLILKGKISKILGKKLKKYDVQKEEIKAENQEENIMREEPKKEEIKLEQKVDNIINEQPKQENIIKEEPKKEEVVKPEPKPEIRKEEPKKEKQKMDKIEENKNDNNKNKEEKGKKEEEKAGQPKPKKRFTFCNIF